jgi:hypothetical protein
MVSAIPMIPLAAEVSRVVRGVRVEHVCGDPNLNAKNDHRLMRRIVETAVRALQTDVTGPTLFDPDESPIQEEVHAS